MIALALLAACNRDPEPESLRQERSVQSTTVAEPSLLAATFAPTMVNAGAPPRVAPRGMVWIPPGEFSMGLANFEAGGHCHEPMDDARPVHRVRLSGFFIDTTEVTNEDFQRFVSSTGYVTLAERAPTPTELPDVAPELRMAGSTVFSPSERSTTNPLSWWRFVRGADWRHPDGPQSNLKGKEHHPVVHVSYDDALAYARWQGKDLPTEAEWEYAARGGETGRLYPWGDEITPDGQDMANTFQGKFPRENTGQDGFDGTAPVRSFPPNGYGLYDVAGNVWEWTSDWYRADTYRAQALESLTIDPRGPATSLDPEEPKTAKRVQRGGSFLCASGYCSRYMVGSRGKGDPHSPSSHIGFRCVLRPVAQRGEL